MGKTFQARGKKPKAASILDRDRFRARLQKLLAFADDASFCDMIWGADALLRGDLVAARKVLLLSASLTPDEIVRNHVLAQWELETLVNEALVTHKRRGGDRRQKTRLLNCTKLETAVQLVRILRRLENAEDGVWLSRHHILAAVRHIAHRQFPWQRGFANVAEFHKYAAIFNFPEADTFFTQLRGLTLDEFSYCCFAFYAHSASHSKIPLSVNLAPAGISNRARDATLKAIAAPIEQVRAEAQALRAGGDSRTAYKASVLRLLPGIIFSDGFSASTVRFPIRDLIALRSTSGIYYDLANASDTIRDRSARNFETYSRVLIQKMLPDVEATPEFSYRKGQFRTPDILVFKEDRVIAAIECKAAKLSLHAQFSPSKEAMDGPGAEEIAKGIFQLWRFFQHARTGVLDRPIKVDDAAVGVVLTLDDWFDLASQPRAEAGKRATTMAAAKKVVLIPADLRPVAICSIRNLGQLLHAGASPEELIETFRRLSSNERLGWDAVSMLEEAKHGALRQRDYPFSEQEIAEALPWWGKIGEARQARQ
jgi:hypothetical protein